MRRLLAVFLLLISSSAAFAQFTDLQAMNELGGPQEFARRRAELGKQLKTGYTLLWARINEPEQLTYREDNDFYYFTGLQDPGAILLMNNETGHSILFEPIQAAREISLSGPNLLGLPEAQRKAYGYSQIFPLHDFESIMGGMFGDPAARELWVRAGFPDEVDGARTETAGDYAKQYSHPLGDPTPGDRSALKKLAERFPGLQLRDFTGIVDEMRNIKTPQEIAILRKNGKISAEALRRAMAKAKPGMFEYQVEAEARYWMTMNGAQGVAYPAIVGSGANSNRWHYFENRKQMQPNEIVVFDFGADLHHLAMDITRTFSVSGKFTPEQAKWYQVGLAAQKAIIAMLKPGNTYEDASAAGRKVFEQAGLESGYFGSRFPGHFVGLSTHDVKRPVGPVKKGQVVTIEPIIDFPDKQLHIRIEDTVLITDGEAEILSVGIPKEMAEVERLVGSEASK
ncbi:MAG TPA: Xaa-Pro peptidase family protein [Terriglobales bacterium]|nr:Xaa-Pro peptidase family protein [Terriglobales bacterium]